MRSEARQHFAAHVRYKMFIALPNEESVARKEFRQDLFFRLNVVPIHVPL
jgi:DNA-binding NtrC family response regulator